jgi:serine/threonine protein kinase
MSFPFSLGTHSFLFHLNITLPFVYASFLRRLLVFFFFLKILKNPRVLGDQYSFGRADCGSPCVISPEVDDGFPVTAAADVWALGCCIYSWVTGESTGEHCSTLREKSIDEILRRVPRRFGTKLRSALRMCLQHHPERRATAKEVWKLLSTSEK